LVSKTVKKSNCTVPICCVFSAQQIHNKSYKWNLDLIANAL